MDTETLLKHRAQKFRHIGGFIEGEPVDPKRKINMKRKEDPTVQIGKISEVELKDEVNKLKQHISEDSKLSTGSPPKGLKEMIEKLKMEIDYEYDEAAKALGMDEKISMVREEVAKARNLNDQNEKIKQLMDEFNEKLPSAPNYSSLMYKLDKLDEFSKALKFSRKNNNVLKTEINKRFKEILDRPDVKQKIETLKAEISNSGISDISSSPELQEKVIELNRELESEFKAVLESSGLEVVSPTAVSKINAFQTEVSTMIDNVVQSSDLKDKIEMLKDEVAKAGNEPDEESQNKIKAMIAEIKKDMAEAMSSPELKEKAEKLFEETKSSLQSNSNDRSKESRVNANLEANPRFN